MNWLWHRKHPGPDPAALHAAEEAKKNAEAQWPDVHHAANGIKRHSDQNHFAELFIAAMRRRES